jgi:serine/threonine protein kinase
MSSCTVCGTKIPPPGRFCSACGTPLPDSGDGATLDFGRSTPPRPSSAGSGPKSSGSAPSSISDGLFLPGILLSGRYRIIALLGRGGMGEVYRADDLTLGQPVALKFLPHEAALDQGLLERFHNEVRTARRVSHPNVCRVYDIGEVDGHNFFTMEYVDGEDLASLLRRIGRLPSDKALEIARQLCAGLAAAHAKGVLHRDMKPANIMLDGRGQVVITDFGLAGVAGQIQGVEVRSGTPAYMAPEQLAGKEVSARSDIYALGLVLYEIFTGRRAYKDAPTETHKSSKADIFLSRPSSVVKDIDPAVERAIMRCLETDPASRPANVLSVAAALPGGDPLAAALAAGETPSPELVAASGETTGLNSKTAITWFAAVLAGLALVAFLSIRNNALDKMSLDQSPEALMQKSREITSQLGYDKHPADSAYGIYNNNDVIQYIEKTEKPHPDWNRILPGRSSLIQFWYRQSPRLMVPDDFRDVMLTPGIIEAWDPPQLISGMVRVELDPQGRLIYFEAVPPELETPAKAPVTPYDWNTLFIASGLDQSQFQPTQPIWNSLGGADLRMAWTGKWPTTNWPLRVEAASWRGQPVFFSLVGEWTKPQRAKGDERTRGEKILGIAGVILLLSMISGAMFLARRNYRLGRSDTEGATRLAFVMFALEMALWLFRSHIVPGLETFFLLLIAASTGLLISGITWLLYLAIEPWIRRKWPQAIISWSRLVTGQVRDSLVGRDLLFGVAFGVLWVLVIQIRNIILIRFGAVPELHNSEYLLGGRHAIGTWLQQVPTSIIATLEFFFVAQGLKALLKKDWLASTIFVLIFTGLHGTSSHPAIDLPAFVVIYGIAAVIMYRYGLVPLACAIFTVDMLANVPLTADLSAWYINTSFFALLSVVALAGWGFYHSLGGKPLLRGEEE